MIVWFYRADKLRAAKEAAERHPSLSLRLEHHSLVLFRREHRNENEPSVLLFDRYEEAKKIIKELNSARDYGVVAIDTFGDEWTGERLREMLSASTYALKQPSGMGSDSYILNGKVSELIDAILNDHANEDAQLVAENTAEHLAALLDVDKDIARRLVKFGVGSGAAMSGMTTDDLTVGGAFTLHEAEEIIRKGTEKGFV